MDRNIDAFSEKRGKREAERKTGEWGWGWGETAKNSFYVTRLAADVIACD